MRDPVALLDALCQPSGPLPGTVVVAAHPGDEVLGAASLLPRIRPLVIVHATDGAPADAWDLNAASGNRGAEHRGARRAALAAALGLCGVEASQTRQIGLTEGEVSYHLVTLTRALAGIVLESRPEIILTHAYEGIDPDHDATAFASASACRLLARDRRPVPAVVEFGAIHARAGGLAPRDFLPAADGQAPPARQIELSGPDLTLKQRMLSCLAWQHGPLEQIAVRAERFRLAPRYSFLVPPHAGTLIYERFSGTMVGRLWRSLAADALRDLGLESPST